MMNMKSKPNHTCQHYQRCAIRQGVWALLAILGWSVFCFVVYHAAKPAKGASHDAVTVDVVR